MGTLNKIQSHLPVLLVLIVCSRVSERNSLDIKARENPWGSDMILPCGDELVPSSCPLVHAVRVCGLTTLSFEFISERNLLDLNVATYRSIGKMSNCPPIQIRGLPVTKHKKKWRRLSDFEACIWLSVMPLMVLTQLLRSLISALLLRAGDVELNPGPTPPQSPTHDSDVKLNPEPTPPQLPTHDSDVKLNPEPTPPQSPTHDSDVKLNPEPTPPQLPTHNPGPTPPQSPTDDSVIKSTLNQHHHSHLLIQSLLKLLMYLMTLRLQMPIQKVCCMDKHKLMRLPHLVMSKVTEN